MFVKNKEKIDFKYRKGSYLAVLKAMTVSFVDENKVSAKDLIDCYGQRIDIISHDLAAEIAPHAVKEEIKIDRTPKKIEVPKKVETVKKSELNDSFIEQILGEIEGDTTEDNTEETKEDTIEETTEVTEPKTCEHGNPCDGTCEECAKKEAKDKLLKETQITSEKGVLKSQDEVKSPSSTSKTSKQKSPKTKATGRGRGRSKKSQ